MKVIMFENQRRLIRRLSTCIFYCTCTLIEHNEKHVFLTHTQTLTISVLIFKRVFPRLYFNQRVECNRLILKSLIHNVDASFQLQSDHVFNKG